MFGLRQKLLLGFGGLLLILVAVSALGIAVLRQHEAAIDTFQRENWRSVVYGRNMIDALDQLDRLALEAAASKPIPNADRLIQSFDENLAGENANITLPGEAELAANLTALWSGATNSYRSAFARLQSPAASPADRRDALAKIQSVSPQVHATARDVVDLNITNMTPLEGHMKLLSDRAVRLTMSLAILGAALAVLLTVLVSRAILLPLRTLTKSCREIEQGNLDLVVQVNSRDELHQLAEAFNAMAANLRELRRTDRAKLVRTQRTTQLAVNSLPDAIAIVNPEGIVELSNDTAQRLFDLAPGMPIIKSRQQALVELYLKVSREIRPWQPQGYEGAIDVFDHNSRARFFLPHAIPIVDADQRLLGVTLVLADVTNLRRLDELKSGLLSVVSHELKTPLTSIRMAVHLLLEERVGSLNSKQAELLIAARDESNRLQTIIADLLDMGQLESGSAELDLAPEPAERLVSDAVAPLETAFHDRGVELLVDVPAGTPPVMADPARIGHVFSNLLTNALKFTAPGGKVQISCQTEDDLVRFFVRDSGIGIPNQYLTRIFERFFRVPRAGQPTGAGLGLAIAREIVQAHGGTIGVESTEGAGSCFNFTLKRADGAAADTTAQTTTAPTSVIHTQGASS